MQAEYIPFIMIFLFFGCVFWVINYVNNCYIKRFAYFIEQMTLTLGDINDTLIDICEQLEK